MKQRKSEKRGCPLAEGLISVRKCDGKVPEKKREQSLKKAGLSSKWSFIRGFAWEKKESSLWRRLVSRPSGLSSEVSPQYFTVKCSAPWAKQFSLCQSHTLQTCTRSTHAIRKENLGLWETQAGDYAWNCLPSKNSALWNEHSSLFLCLIRRFSCAWCRDAATIE